jgi:hypothetical protein
VAAHLMSVAKYPPIRVRRVAGLSVAAVLLN